MSDHVLISADRVDFAYDGNAPIFHDISVDIRHGETIGIMGDSGVGKSTLLKLLAGLVPPRQGKVTSRADCRGGFVFQTPVLLEWLTVRQNIVFPDHGIDEEHLSLLIDQMQLADAAQKHPMELSGGMRSRVQLARALYRKPDVLFLDESFSGLDERLRYKLNLLVKKSRGSLFTSAVTISHSVEETVFLADRVLVLRRDSPAEPVSATWWNVSPTAKTNELRSLDAPEFRTDVTRLRDAIFA